MKVAMFDILSLIVRYEPDLNCHWTVVGPADKVIRMRFTSFDLGNFAVNDREEMLTQ